MHGPALAALGRAFGPAPRLPRILGEARLAILVELGQVELRRAIAQVGRAADVAQARLVLGLNAPDAIRIEAGQVHIGRGGRRVRRQCDGRLRRGRKR